ncbi:aa3-type cytochrome c oxidase subunit IV, partial [Enterobacter hormaechei]|uniref:aa3-type cytochrome c oxidase subunit IV n=1 Tax=Enterobacter hormaechei TaxID=158836 RepID=UPI001953EF7F
PCAIACIWRSAMASEPRLDGTAPMDYAEHEKTYDLFISLTKWGSISVIVILVLMAYFLI